jgi:peptide/nickel transport system substrate-binding protein
MNQRSVGRFSTFVLLAALAPVASAAEKNLVFASPYGVTTLDPSVSYSTEITYMNNIYETLLRVNPPGSKEMYRYVLATAFTAAPDGREYTFTLRKGVKFHDGTPFTAEAVKLTIERTKKLGKGAAFIWDGVKEVQVVDDYTVKFILKSPVPLPQIVASSNAAYIMSPKAVEKDSLWFDKGNDAGTGPYRLTQYKDGESAILAKFDDYWGGWNGKHVENVLVKFTRDPLVQLQMLQAGEAQLVGRLPLDSYKAVKEGKDTTVIYGPSYQNYVAFFNVKRPPLDNVKVRQALTYAMPYKDIINVGFAGAATQARGIVPQGQFGFSEKVMQYTYDLDKAKALLAEAGFPKGSLKLVLTYASENPQEQRFAPLIQSEFKKLGVDLEIQPLAWNTQWAKGKGDPKERQDIFLLLWWPTYSDPYETLFSLLHDEGDKPEWNLAYYKSPAYDTMIKKAYETVGVQPSVAIDMYVNAQNMIQKDCPVAPLVDVTGLWPLSRKLKGLVINPAYPNVVFFYDTYLE